MKHCRTRLFSALLTVYGVLGAVEFTQAQVACTQTTIDSSQNFLRINANENICATNSGLIQVTDPYPAFGLEILGPNAGSATLLLTNASAGEIVVNNDTPQGISIDSGRGLDATIVNQGFVQAVGADASGESFGIYATDDFMNGDSLVLQNQGTIEVTAAGSGTGVYFNHTVVSIDNDGDIRVSGNPTTSFYSLTGVLAKSYDKLTATSLISNHGWITVNSQSTDPLSGHIAGIISVGGSVSNTGIIEVQGVELQSIVGISVSEGDNGTISNSGRLLVQSVNSELAAGIVFSGELANIQNSGTLQVTSGSGATFSHEVAGISSALSMDLAASSSIVNARSITVTSQSTLQDASVYGINVRGGAVSNSGDITASAIAGQVYGIRNLASANGGSVTNAGIVSTRIDTGTGVGIVFEGTGDVTNSGTVTVGGYRTQAPSLAEGIGIDLYGPGALTNAGTITVTAGSGALTGAVQYNTGSGSFNNSGAITVAVTGASGSSNSATGLSFTAASSSSVTATNSGTITATTTVAANGSDKAIGVHLAGQNITFNNTGTIKAQGSTARAIEVVSTNTIVELDKNSVIVGDIYTNQQGNVLRHNVGAAQAYVLETTGDWILEDLDGRAVVTGSSMAAGVGWAETADEMLFERTQMFLQSMDRGQMRRDQLGDSAVWVDPYAFNSERSASSSDPTVVKYSSNGFGLTLGYDFKAFGIKAQAIGNIQSGRLNIEDNTQDIDSTSWLVGLRLPSFYEVGSVSFSAMALAGRNQYNSDNQVLTNTTSTGMATYSSSFGSTQLLFGLGAKYSTPISEKTNLSLKADLYLSQEYLEGYQEGPYFSWSSRTLTQGSAFLEAGLDHQATDQWLLQAKLGANTQKLFSGATTSYSINNTPVSFSGGQTSDTGLYAMLGAQYQVQDNARVGLSVWYGQTTNSVKTVQGMLEAKILF